MYEMSVCTCPVGRVVCCVTVCATGVGQVSVPFPIEEKSFHIRPSMVGCHILALLTHLSGFEIPWVEIPWVCLSHMGFYA